MGLGSRIRSSIRNLLRKQDIEAELDEEVRAYVDQVAEELAAAGMPAAEARRFALAEFGGVEQVKQAVRDHRAGTAIELLWQDVRYGLRQLRRNPGFTLTAVLTLGLGIGATTAIFSAVYSLLLHPLPYPDANRLMYISTNWPKKQEYGLPWLDPDFVAAQDGTKSFEQFAGYISSEFNDNLTGDGDPIRVTTMRVTANLFHTLSLSPQFGRNFSTSEDRVDGALVVMLSDRLWRHRFSANTSILGKSITLSGKERTIVGVLPRGFSFPDSRREPDLYVPAALDRDTTIDIRKPLYGMDVIARLRPEVSRQQAQAEIDAFFLARAKGYPPELTEDTSGRQMKVEQLQSHITGDDRKPLYILLVCVAAVLLIACANVANLQLARAVSRRHETAVRGALGASRLRLVRQFLIESLTLSSLAAALGLTIAFVVTSLVRYAGTLDESAMLAHSGAAQLLRLPFGKLSAVIQVDGWVLAFTAGLALFATLLFGLAPAIGGTRSDLRNALQSAALRVTTSREQRRLRHSLLIVEVGLAIVLLSCAGLLMRSFVNVIHYESGFDPSNTLTGVTILRVERVSSLPEHIRNFVNELLPRLSALPGVQTAAIASTLPLEWAPLNTAFLVQGVPEAPFPKWPTASVVTVTPDYFRTVGTPLLSGRAFNSSDRDGAPPVVIISRAFADRYFVGEVLGKRLKTNIGGKNAHDFTMRTVVGVAQDVRHNGIEQEVQPELFMPMDQVPGDTINIALRTSVDPATVANAMRTAVTEVDRSQPLFDVQTMDQRVSNIVAQRKLIMLLIACFAMLAVVLSAVGVYGVFAYSVSQRTHEMGIRLALGASRGGLLGLVATQAARLILLGGVLGIGVAWGLSRLLASMLVGVTPHDAVSFTLAWALMTAVALLASAIPASDAARTDLISVLHSE